MWNYIWVGCQNVEYSKTSFWTKYVRTYRIRKGLEAKIYLLIQVRILHEQIENTVKCSLLKSLEGKVFNCNQLQHKIAVQCFELKVEVMLPIAIYQYRSVFFRKWTINFLCRIDWYKACMPQKETILFYLYYMITDICSFEIARNVHLKIWNHYLKVML